MDRELKEVLFFCMMWILGAVVLMVASILSLEVGWWVIGGCVIGIGIGYWFKMLSGERK